MRVMISYPFPCWSPFLSLWKGWLCPRGYHLFDEYETGNMEGGKYVHIHGLVCDACDMDIIIKEINDA